MKSIASAPFSFCLGVPCRPTFAEITGEVRDQAAAVPNAVVTAANRDQHYPHRHQQQAGIYSLPPAPGRYDVKAVKDGFRAITRTDIELQVQQTARIDFSMESNPGDRMVEVLGGAPCSPPKMPSARWWRINALSNSRLTAATIYSLWL
jgi:hypothetical protein